MHGYIVYIVCAGFVSGVFIRSFLHFGIYEILCVFLVSVILCVVWRQKSFGFLSPLFLSSIFLIATACGMFRMDIADTRPSIMKQYAGSGMEFVGKIVREPEARAQNIHLHIVPKIEGEYTKEYVLVTLDRFTYSDTFTYGDIVTVKGEVTLPKEFETNEGRYFNYPGYLRAKNIETVVPYASVSILSVGEPSYMRILFMYKHRFMESLEEILPHPHAGLGEGILLGVKRALGEDLEEAFRKTGIIHIVVLSGYNVLIVVEVMMILLSYVCGLRMRMVLGLLGIGIFTCLVGFSATVVRASVMAMLLLVARATGRVYAILRALALTGMIMLAFNPHILLHDIGFQLSFLATFGLIVFSPYFEKHLIYIPNMLGFRGIVSATIATQIIVLPLLLYHTGLLSFVSIFVNALVLPMVSLAMLLTFLTGIIGIFSTSLGIVLGFFAYGSLNYVINIAETFAKFSFSAKTVTVFPFWWVMVAYLFLFLWYLLKVKDTSDVAVFDMETKEKNIINDYNGWIIEEGEDIFQSMKEKTPEALRASGDKNTPLPFR